MTTASSQAPPPGRTYRSPRLWGLVALTYALAALAGAAAKWIGIPLPWMLGPFFVFAALSVAGATFALLPMGREIGQVAIGTAVGLRFTAEVLVATAALLPAMLAATAYVIAYTLLAAFLFRPMARVDRVTGFFATAAGGVADMAIVADRLGGHAGPVAVVHAMRVSVVVAVVPFLVLAFGVPGTRPDAAAATAGSWMLVPVVLALGFLVAWALKPTPIPNPWLVGPIFLGLLIGVSGLVVVTVPRPLIVIAQIMLGTWLGCRFRRDLLMRLPRVTAAALVIAVFMVACAALGAAVLSGATGLSFATSFLSLAPAAVTEMVLTAQVMHLEAEIVTAFHVMRIAVVASTVLLVFRLYTWMGGAKRGPSV